VTDGDRESAALKANGAAQSPHHGRAPNGGDVGVRYTPETIEIIRRALELRKKGIIKF
jgi:hypothetical protein